MVKRLRLQPEPFFLGTPENRGCLVLRALARQREVRTYRGAVKPEADERQRHHSQNRVPVQIFLLCPRFSLHAHPPSLWESDLLFERAEQGQLLQQPAVSLVLQLPLFIAM